MHGYSSARIDYECVPCIPNPPTRQRQLPASWCRRRRGAALARQLWPGGGRSIAAARAAWERPGNEGWTGGAPAGPQAGPQQGPQRPRPDAARHDTPISGGARLTLSRGAAHQRRAVNAVRDARSAMRQSTAPPPSARLQRGAWCSETGRAKAVAAVPQRSVVVAVRCQVSQRALQCTYAWSHGVVWVL